MKFPFRRHTEYKAKVTDATKIPFETPIITNPIVNLPAVLYDPDNHRYERLELNDLPTFVEKDLNVKRLEHIRKQLWLCGAGGQQRPLSRLKGYYQRQIVVIHQTDLHLTWDSDTLRMFVKPLPAYLLNVKFWRDYICTDSDSESDKTTFINALGFLRTYVALIYSEIDLNLAIQEQLLPKVYPVDEKNPASFKSTSRNCGEEAVDITWPQWRAFIEEFLTLYPKSKLPELQRTRWEYGELRLGRLNSVYRLCVRGHIFRGYEFGYASYGNFLSRNSSWLIAAFAYVAIVHGAMQVGLGTPQLETNEAFARACYGFTVFSIVAPVGILSILFIWMALMIISNAIWSRQNKEELRKTRHKDMESTLPAQKLSQPMRPTA